MTTRLLKSDDGDLDLSTNNFVIIDDSVLDIIPATGTSQMAQAIKQKAEDVLRQFLGEWFLDQTAGVPWLQTVLGQKNPDFTIIKSIFKKKLLAIDNVGAVDDVTFDFDSSTRTLVYEVVIIAVDGSAVTVSSG